MAVDTQWATVKYQIGTYEGTVRVRVDDGDDTDALITRAKRELRRRAGGASYLPCSPCYESWSVLD